MSGDVGTSAGVNVEVVRSYLVAAAEEMRATLIRTAFNPVIYEVLDFGISIYDARQRLVAEAPGLTRFLGANDYSLGKGIEYVGLDNLHRGDIVLLNYPFWNAAHASDATMFAPVFEAEPGDAGDGVLVGFVCVRTHWMDLGAKDPGYVLDSTDVHQEGMLFPGTKVFDRGVLDRQIVELIRFNSRMPEVVIGDLHAQVATLRTGERRLLDIVAKFGRDERRRRHRRLRRPRRACDPRGRGGDADRVVDRRRLARRRRHHHRSDPHEGDGHDRRRPLRRRLRRLGAGDARPGEHALRLDDRLGAGGVQGAHQPVRPEQPRLHGAARGAGRTGDAVPRRVPGADVHAVDRATSPSS